VRVAHDLERERGERLVVARLARDHRLLVADLVALDGLDVERRGQVGDDGVEHGLDALVLERRAGEHRGELAGDGRATDRGVELVLGGLFALEVLLHHRVVGLGDRLEETVAPLAAGLGVSRRDVEDVVVLALLGVLGPHERLHAELP
jgi:hypothetical protein